MAGSSRHLTFTLACMLSVGACGTRGSYDPIPEASQRLVVTPQALAVLTQQQTFFALPAEITFGGPGGRSALYLLFPPEWRAHGAPLKAYLALEPLVGEAVQREPARV